jgi:hypothetical protein
MATSIATGSDTALFGKLPTATTTGAEITLAEAIATTIATSTA